MHLSKISGPWPPILLHHELLILNASQSSPTQLSALGWKTSLQIWSSGLLEMIWSDNIILPVISLETRVSNREYTARRRDFISAMAKPQGRQHFSHVDTTKHLLSSSTSSATSTKCKEQPIQLRALILLKPPLRLEGVAVRVHVLIETMH